MRKTEAMADQSPNGTGPKNSPLRRNRWFTRRKDVRGALADCARAIENGDIDSERGRAWAYALRLLDASMKDRDLATMAKRVRKFAQMDEAQSVHADN